MTKNINTALKLIKSFYTEELHFNGDKEILQSLQEEKNIEFPKEFQEYINEFLPSEYIDSSTIGNPIDFCTKDQLSWKMDGYNYNSVENNPIEDWDENWFIFANEGADPYIIKLDEKEEFSKVYKAYHGEGSWDFFPVADSIGEFLLSAFSLSHALIGFEGEESISDDENGFNLIEPNASWLFSFLKKHTPKYYDEWSEGFDNA